MGILGYYVGSPYLAMGQLKTALQKGTAEDLTDRVVVSRVFRTFS